MRKLIIFTVIVALVLTTFGLVGASSHREAPLISQDPVADTTDVYMFVSPDAPDTVTLIQSVYPGQDAGSGPNFYRFGDDVIYAFSIDNDGDAKTDIQFRFDFHTTIANDDTFLYNFGPIAALGDANQNVVQTYDVKRVDYPDHGKATRTCLGTGLLTPPSNFGPASTPDYGSLMAAAVHDLGNGVKVYAGQSDDASYIDLGAIFDLLTIRPLDLTTGNVGGKGGGVDTLAGFNVQSIALQVPIADLLDDSGEPVIGMWASSERRTTTIRSAGGMSTRGVWVEVSRLGMPLVNEVVIPLKDKDKWNGSEPKDDAQFLSYVTDPELATLLNALYFTPLRLTPVPETGRTDLVSVFLTGVEGLNMPANVVASEQLRLNTSILPSDPSCTGDRLGVLAGDLCGFPNGRRPTDDVVDIAERVVAGVLFDPATFNTFPYNALGDGVDANDLAFQSTFPYLAVPHAGFTVGNHDVLTPLVP